MFELPRLKARIRSSHNSVAARTIVSPEVTEFNLFVLLSSSRVVSIFSRILKKHLPIAVDLNIESNPRNYIVFPTNKFLSLFTIHASSMTRCKSLIGKLDKRSTWRRYQLKTDVKSIWYRKNSDVRQDNDSRTVTPMETKADDSYSNRTTVLRPRTRYRDDNLSRSTLYRGARLSACANWRKLFQSRGVERRNLRVAELRYGEEVR
jgi:hypothetical protein